MHYVHQYCKCSKNLNTFLFLYSNKMFNFRAGFHKMLVRMANREKTLIRLLLKKQSDLGLHYLSRPFWQATSFRNFRTFAVAT